MRDSQIHISKDNVIYNYKLIKKRANNFEVAPVIKANAFGHGLTELASIYQELGCRMVIVAYISEAIEIRESGYKNDILLLVPPVKKDLEDLVLLGLETTIAEEETAHRLNEIAKKNNKIVKVHVFINTGMNREGKKPHKIPKFLDSLKKLNHLKIEGILSHFAASDLSENLFNNYQIEQFKKTVQIAKNEGFTFNKIHLHNSGAIFNFPDSNQETFFNLYRPGIASYGLLADKSTADKVGLRPVLSLKTKIHHLIKINKGETCGYNFQFTARRSGNLAIIPIGFGDGLARNLTDKLRVIIRDKFYPIVGFISMDLTIVDIGNDEIEQGDEVIIIGKSNSNEITVYELAEKLGTITYEITTMLSRRLPRVLI